MRDVLLMCRSLIGLFLAAAAPALADGPEIASQPPTAESAAEQESGRGQRFGDVGDGNRMRFRSPINVLSHVQVTIHITIGAPTAEEAPAVQPPAAGQVSPPAMSEARPAARASQDEGPAASQPQTLSLRQARRRVRRLDEDGDRLLSREELQRQLPARRAARWLETLDADGDGHLSDRELTALGKPTAPKTARPKPERAVGEGSAPVGAAVTRGGS